MSTGIFCRPQVHVKSTIEMTWSYPEIYCSKIDARFEEVMARNKKKKRRERRLNEVQKPAKRPRKLRQWTDDGMVRAMNSVQSGILGVNEAAREYKIPPTTLKDRLSGRVIHGTNMGAKPYLSHEEERELVEFLLNCAKMGYGKTRKEVLYIVHATVQKKGIKVESGITQGWWVKFCRRWPEIKLRKGDSFPLVRDQMTNHTVFKSYFDLLDETLTKHGLKDKPGQIYNCDESGIPLEHKLPRIIAAKGTKKVRQRTSGTKTQITILACANAAGRTIPLGEVPATLYGMSRSGWMDQEIFTEWFSNHFMKHAVSSRPLLLMLDGHSSHYTLELVKMAAEQDIIIFCLPPHTTADSQPLDTSCFKPLKSHWVDVCRRYLFANPSRVITKFHFSSLFSQAWSRSMTTDNISSGFRTTGIWPFNPNAILSKFPMSKETNTSSTRTNPITFSAEMVKKFEKRFENGYNIYTDEMYVQWMQMYHPDHLPPG